jgi:hypothetical protein
VEHAREEYEVSERRACRVVRQWRGTQRYLPLRRTDEDELTRAILALAMKYGRYGYRRITVLLRSAGWQVGKDRVQRIWRREGLKVPLVSKAYGVTRSAQSITLESSMAEISIFRHTRYQHQFAIKPSDFQSIKSRCRGQKSWMREGVSVIDRKTDTVEVKSAVEQKTNSPEFRPGFKWSAKVGSSLGPDSAEQPLKPYYKTQNRAKRFNRLDNWNCFGTRGSEVQILSPRPSIPKQFIGLGQGGLQIATNSKQPALAGHETDQYTE